MSDKQISKEAATNSRKMRTGAASAYLGLAVSTLAKMRMRGDGPEYIKAGPKVVLYDSADCDAWLASKRRRSTSEAAA
jgi:predicted DNA-binding transcriptional regulator AlpA